MTQLLPPRFLFDWSFPVRQGSGQPLAVLGSEYTLPAFNDYDGAASFAEWRIAWHADGLALQVEVSGKTTPTIGRPTDPINSDHVQIWLDTRNTRNVHRATRFCHQYIALPTDPRQRPSIITLDIANARESSRKIDAPSLQVASEVRTDGYQLRLWIPAGALQGYDPENHPRLSFFSLVHDMELGDQTPSVGREFPYAFDPSLWHTLELTR